MKSIRSKSLLIVFSLWSVSTFLGCAPGKTPSAQGREMADEASIALEELYRTAPGAKELGAKAKGILVFPRIIKGGFVAGGQYGEGTLFSQGRAMGHYSSVAGSWGLQAGIQKFGYALFFMTEDDLSYLRGSDGWEVGVGPSVVVLDQGMARAITTTTARSGVYAFFFSQKGLMAGVGIQGTKISKLDL